MGIKPTNLLHAIGPREVRGCPHSAFYQHFCAGVVRPVGPMSVPLAATLAA
jgi:hypothetical protein